MCQMERPMNKYKSIRVLASTYQSLRIEAAKRDLALSAVFELAVRALVDDKKQGVAK